MDPNTNIAAWMIGGGLRADPGRERNRAHLRAIEAKRIATPLLVRLAAAAATFRASAPTRELDCCPTPA